MKLKMISLAVITVFISSCGFNGGTFASLNSTEVVLDEANYTYVGNATGEATSTYVLGFGPFGDQILVQKAKQDLADKVNLYDGARALVNMTVDVKVSYFLFVVKHTAFISADVVEFN